MRAAFSARAWRLPRRLVLHGLLGALLLAGLPPALADWANGVVVRVSDGDSLVLDTHDGRRLKVRLAGIDAPEKAQPFGPAAQQALARQVLHHSVTVELQKKDRYGRWVGKVLRGSQDINLAQLQAGLAWHYTAYAAEQLPAERRAYAQAEALARSALRGLWREPAPVAPWAYRKARRAASALPEACDGMGASHRLSVQSAGNTSMPK